MLLLENTTKRKRNREEKVSGNKTLQAYQHTSLVQARLKSQWCYWVNHFPRCILSHSIQTPRAPLLTNRQGPNFIINNSFICCLRFQPSYIKIPSSFWQGHPIKNSVVTDCTVSAKQRANRHRVDMSKIESHQAQQRKGFINDCKCSP